MCSTVVQLANEFCQDHSLNYFCHTYSYNKISKELVFKFLYMNSRRSCCFCVLAIGRCLGDVYALAIAYLRFDLSSSLQMSQNENVLSTFTLQKHFLHLLQIHFLFVLIFSNNVTVLELFCYVI